MSPQLTLFEEKTQASYYTHAAISRVGAARSSRRPSSMWCLLFMLLALAAPVVNPEPLFTARVYQVDGPFRGKFLELHYEENQNLDEAVSSFCQSYGAAFPQLAKNGVMCTEETRAALKGEIQRRLQLHVLPPLSRGEHLFSLAVANPAKNVTHATRRPRINFHLKDNPAQVRAKRTQDPVF